MNGSIRLPVDLVHMSGASIRDVVSQKSAGGEEDLAMSNDVVPHVHTGEIIPPVRPIPRFGERIVNEDVPKGFHISRGSISISQIDPDTGETVSEEFVDMGDGEVEVHWGATAESTQFADDMKARIEAVKHRQMADFFEDTSVFRKVSMRMAIERLLHEGPGPTLLTRGLDNAAGTHPIREPKAPRDNDWNETYGGQTRSDVERQMAAAKAKRARKAARRATSSTP